MTGTARRSSQAGFTLLEVLAAFAITALVIMGIGTLIHHVAFSFDRGINGVTEAERSMLAMDRLARDFGAARFVTSSGEAPPASGKEVQQDRPVAFAGQANKVVFISSSARDGNGSEVVMLTVELLDSDMSQLVRRRARWLGPGAGSLEEPSGDPVVLLKGHYTISFSFEAQDGWADDWTGRATLPRLVRLNIRDAITGASRVARADFSVRADAPVACISGSIDCLPAANAPGSPHERPAI